MTNPNFLKLREYAAKLFADGDAFRTEYLRFVQALVVATTDDKEGLNILAEEDGTFSTQTFHDGVYSSYREYRDLESVKRSLRRFKTANMPAPTPEPEPADDPELKKLIATVEGWLHGPFRYDRLGATFYPGQDFDQHVAIILPDGGNIYGNGYTEVAALSRAINGVYDYYANELELLGMDGYIQKYFR